MEIRIKKILKSKGIKVSTLAERAGVTQSSMSNIINGKVNTTLLTLGKIAEILGVEIWELFTERTTVEVFQERHGELNAIIVHRGKPYVVFSIEELEKVVCKLKALD